MGDEMTHLPLKLGEHTTASGPVTITGFSRHGKWAFDAQSRCWSVETGLYGKYFHDAAWDITGRVEPAPVPALSRRFVPVRMIEAGPIEAEMARVTAERDEAVALLRRWNALNIGGTKTTPETRAFLTKIGGKP